MKGIIRASNHGHAGLLADREVGDAGWLHHGVADVVLALFSAESYDVQSLACSGYCGYEHRASHSVGTLNVA